MAICRISTRPTRPLAYCGLRVPIGDPSSIRSSYRHACIRDAGDTELNGAPGNADRRNLLSGSALSALHRSDADVPGSPRCDKLLRPLCRKVVERSRKERHCPNKGYEGKRAYLTIRCWQSAEKADGKGRQSSRYPQQEPEDVKRIHCASDQCTGGGNLRLSHGGFSGQWRRQSPFIDGSFKTNLVIGSANRPLLLR